MQNFVHLHLHSQYSLLESSITFEQMVGQAVEQKMPSIAVTDNGNMFGAIEFYKEAEKKGVNPILGCEVYLAPNGRLQKGAAAGVGRGQNPQSFPRLVLLAQNVNGYRNLCQLVSRGFTEGFYYKPRIDDEILQMYHEDLLCLTSSMLGDVPTLFFNQGEEKALARIQFYKELFGDRFYLEVQRNGGATKTEAWEKLIGWYKDVGAKENIPLVATNEPHFMTREDSYAQEVLMCIQAGRTLIEDRRPRLPSDQFYLKSPKEMYQLFKDMPEVVERTVEVAQRCRIEFQFTDEKGQTIYHLPSFPVSQGKTIKEEIEILAKEGLERRFKEAASRGEEVSEEQKPSYFKRLSYELEVISKMGFEGYFLIVQDFINYAKDNGIPVGPGRGSGAGSLVAYSLRITDLDPMKHELLFERFLNPERISMPDFDIDFCQDRRPEVIDYVTEKYGAESVAQIITFGKLQARAAIRDVGRAMGFSYGEVDHIAKLIPDKLGIKLKEALEMEPKLPELMEDDPKVGSLLNTAIRLEGLTRHASIHAAGVIISDRPLVEHCPLYKANEGETVIQLDMVHAEKIGLIKFDFLGLKTLTMIDNAIKMVRRNFPERENFQASDISLEDPAIYELLSKGDTAGVFQFEGDGISELIRKFKPNCFADITAINALYRPGPMNMLDEYVARKHGKIKVTYLFPQLEDILKETYGIIVYQEQVQLIAARCANYSLGEADILRRAMGKKKAEEMAKQKVRFLQGAEENELDLKKAEELFTLMEKFAAYGFNKSHAAAYCVVAAQTAYLKALFPVEFYASLITTEMSDTDKIVKYIRDARDHKIVVRGPDVNSSEYKFTARDGEIVFGLGGIKGVGEAAVIAILEAREQLEGQKFSSLLEFFESVDLRRVNKKVVECLTKAGAFDSMVENRAQLFTGFEKFLDAAESSRRDKEVGQTSLFQLEGAEEETKVELPDVEDWSRSQKLAFEKEVLGFYISDHPMNGLDGILRSKTTCTIEGLSDQTPKKKVMVAGIVGSLKEFITKKGTRMAFGTLEDQTSVVELVIFAEAYSKHQESLKGSKPLVIMGQLERETDVNKILVEDVRPVNSLFSQGKELLYIMSSSKTASDDVENLAKVIKRHPGPLKGRIDLRMPDIKKKVLFSLGPDFGVAPSEEFFEDLDKTIGPSCKAHLL